MNGKLITTCIAVGIIAIVTTPTWSLIWWLGSCIAYCGAVLHIAAFAGMNDKLAAKIKQPQVMEK